MGKVFGTQWNQLCPSGPHKKGESIIFGAFAHNSRFPIVSGLQVQWDHRLPPGKRVKSIRLVNPPSEEDDEVDNPEDMVDFVEQGDGTRVEVKQRKMDLGDEVKNEEGGRVYRVVSDERESIAETRSLASTWHLDMTVLKP